VFVTALEVPAVQALEQGTVDCLLNPVVEERLQLCVDCLRAKSTAPLSQVRAVWAGLQSRAALQVQQAPQAAFVRWISAARP